MFSLIALLFSYRRQQADALRLAVVAAPARTVANDRAAVRSLARAA